MTSNLTNVSGFLFFFPLILNLNCAVWTKSVVWKQLGCDVAYGENCFLLLISVQCCQQLLDFQGCWVWEESAVSIFWNVFKTMLAFRRKKWRYFFFMQLHVRTSLSCCAVPFRCWRSCLNSRISSKPGYRKRNGLAFLCFKMLKTSILFTRGFKQAAANESACNLSFLQVISACAVSHPCSEALVLTTFTTWLKGLKRRTLSMLSASLK